MYPLNDIIEIIAVTGYRVIPSTRIQPNFIDEIKIANPTISIGYSAIHPENANSNQLAHSNIVHDLGQNLVQYVDINIFSTLDLLHIHWRKVFSQIIGKNTLPREYQFNGFSFAGGAITGLEGDYIWWLDRWGIGFPTVNKFV